MHKKLTLIIRRKCNYEISECIVVALHVNKRTSILFLEFISYAMSLQCNSRRLISIDSRKNFIFYVLICVAYWDQIKGITLNHNLFRLFSEWIAALLRLAVESSHFYLATWNGRRNGDIKFFVFLSTGFEFFETCFRWNAGKKFFKLL